MLSEDMALSPAPESQGHLRDFLHYSWIIIIFTMMIFGRLRLGYSVLIIKCVCYFLYSCKNLKNMFVIKVTSFLLILKVSKMNFRGHFSIYLIRPREDRQHRAVGQIQTWVNCSALFVFISI